MLFIPPWTDAETGGSEGTDGCLPQTRDVFLSLSECGTGDLTEAVWAGVPAVLLKYSPSRVDVP